MQFAIEGPAFQRRTSKDGLELLAAEKIVKQYLISRDLPAWFRGTSAYQLKAAERLFDSIRDDCQQGSSHRVRRCLSDIGLQPKIGDADAKFLMKLSRGNDLAFLWFILERFYRTPGQTYSFSEQLIMTLISHLDMITTLRELDRILPKGQLSADEIRQIKKLSELNEKRERREQYNRMSKIRHIESQLESSSMSFVNELQSPKYNLPYFQTLRKPIKYGGSLKWKPKDIPLHFGVYEKYNDPIYVVHNETNRWYAEHEFQRSRRIAEGVLKNEVTKVIKKGIAQNDVLNNVQIEGEVSKPEKPLCEHHKVLHDLEKSLEHQLNVIARDKCLDYFYMKTCKKELCRKRITTQLEKDVNIYLSKFRKMTEPMRKQNYSVGKEDTMHVIDKCNTCCAYNLNEINQMDDDEEQELPKCKHTLSEIHIIDRCDEYHTHQVNDIIQNDKECRKKCPNAGGKKQQRTIDILKKSGVEPAKREQGKHKESCVSEAPAGMGDFDTRYEIAHNYRSKKQKKKEADDNRPTFKRKDGGDCANIKCKTTLQPKKVSKYGCGHEYLEKYDYGHCDAKSVSSTENFFEPPDDHKPFQFNFYNIFRFKTEDENYDNNTEFNLIKEAAAKAVDSSIDFHHRELNEPIDMDAIVTNFAKKTFKKKVKLREEQEQEEEEKVVSVTDESLFSRDYYDPDDKELMHSLLKAALQRMRSNPKFVLASMPDSDKIPFLRLWIYRRYGKRYNTEELTKAYCESTRIFHALNSLTLNVKMPRPRELGKQLYVSYSCRNYIVRKAKHLRRSYYDLLDNSIMEQSRCLWFAMRPYFCYRPPRNTFFAYMPASLKDIYHFRTWDPNEFMNAKKAWDIRVIQRNHPLYKKYY